MRRMQLWKAFGNLFANLFFGLGRRVGIDRAEPNLEIVELQPEPGRRLDRLAAGGGLAGWGGGIR